MEDPYELAYSEAVRALTQQREAFESLRGRAGVLLSGAAIASSLLGSQAFALGPLGAAGWLAVAAFVLLGQLATGILWPGREWLPVISGADLIATHIENENAASLAATHRDLTLYLDAAYDENQREYDRRATQLRAATVLLNLEITAWVVELALKGV